MSEFVMPSLGADMESAILMEWLVKVGDHVTKGQVIAEVETSKGVIEIEVFEEGIVDKLLVKEETECAVGTPLAIIRGSDEAAVTQVIEKAERIKASPAARKKAKEMGVELSSLAASGKVHLAQLETFASKAPKIIAPNGMRQAIAKAMSRSNAEIPHYYLSTSINMTPALNWLEALNATRTIAQRILPAALLIRAVVLALKEVPELNGFWQDGGPQISEQINPGIAIALRKGGLITPALINTNELSLDETMHSLGDLISRTRAGKLRNTEMTQQTITITNLGDLGVESVYGVIYPPQVAIVGLGRIMDAPWAQGDSLSVRKIMQATLAGDHRATDGRTGALFLDKLNQILQDPQELL
ncbi:MAG TPA: dihydrolipoamide acetyltransferase family protein [Sulfuricurvum sp.]|nr:MAG: pyruvate dehydrogenase [Campylobacterales bacterium 16-40-21]OZA03850.1 MAG: pyruvate dehydrogenase [Sulfuricurvum sp. 17-40-25]HQS65630.1 dihydrolipoamide acetyltransferase family protein [Sulfuricurvum sp.]HQT36136.1 dihydrolipoamide acetyltransferase family protein [Sulfuricurvum sp.]